MTIRVARFTAAHADNLLKALIKVRSVDEEFPPRTDATSDAPSLERWLYSDEDTLAGRWVALENGIAIGHVQVTTAHGYIRRHLDLDEGALVLELGKLFVAPEARGLGAGAALLSVARDYARSQGAALALAVLPNSAAIVLYQREGLRAAGTFEGVHGLNLVFVDQPFLA